MQLNIKHIAILPPLLALLTACSWDELLYEDPTSPPLYEKTPIELTIGGVDSPTPALTRAVITTDPYNPHNFTMNTKIFMVMKSEYGTADYQGSHTTKYTVTRGDVAAGSNKVTFDSYNQRYWDDAHARSSKLSIWAYAQQDIPENNGWLSATFQIPNSTWSPISPETPEHLLQEYESHQYFTNNNTNPWIDEVAGHTKGAIYPCIMTWKASHNNDKTQNATSLKYQDLLFSNNLVDNSATGTDLGGSDLSLKFNFTTRKFPQEGDALMKFYHAMSKITIKIIEGEGFNTSSDADFQFTPASSNVKLSGFNTEGTFNIKNGYFEMLGAQYDIPSIAKTINKGVNPNPYYTLEALAIPNIYGTNGSTDGFSRFVSDKKNYDTDVMMEFTIDNNKYQVTSGQLYDALHVGGNPLNALVTNATEKTDNGTYIPLEAGKNYVFTFTVGKTKIKNITAQVAEWEEVNAENIDPSNARIELQLEERGTAYPSDGTFSLYRSTANYTADGINDDFTAYDWKTGYSGNVTTPSYVAAGLIPAHWTTDWYWESNKHFYHFRTLAPTTQAVTTDADNGDYTTLTSAASYTDVLWGAPMLDDGTNEDHGSFKWKYGPTKNGFDANDENAIADGLSGSHQIYKAIGPTENPVKLILFHMMSDLTFNIKTTDGTDKVELCHDNGEGNYTQTRLDLVGFYNGGKVLLGTGLVNTTGSASTASSPINVPFNSATDKTQYVPQVYKFGAVPQDLTNVKLYIITPDNNQYIVDLKDVVVTSGNITSNNIVNPYTTNSSGKYIINRWYPGFKYNYSFTLAKTGITNLQATIVDWETVTADNETVQIK